MIGDGPIGIDQALQGAHDAPLTLIALCQDSIDPFPIFVGELSRPSNRLR